MSSAVVLFTLSLLKMIRNLQKIFDAWASETKVKYNNNPLILSKWEPYAEIVWSQEKIDSLFRNIKENLNLRITDSIIELGCGNGWILSDLAKFARQPYGLDISLEMLKSVQSVVPQSHLISGEIGNLPLKDKSVDCILSYFVFINFTDDVYVEKAFSEIVRILNDGGRALIGQLPDKNGSAKYDQARDEYYDYCQKVFKLKEDLRNRCKPPLRLFDKSQLERLLKTFNIRYRFVDSFNPFYRTGQPKFVDWRFDVIIER